MHGCHKFKNRRYIDTNGLSINHLTTYESNGFRELYSYYSQFLSYKELSNLLERVIGVKPYGKRHLQNKVGVEAQAISNYLKAPIPVKDNQLSLHLVVDVDIYEEFSKELHYFDDAIGVKRQNEERKGADKAGTKSSKTVQTDVIVIGNEDLGYDYLSSAEANLQGVSLVQRIDWQLAKYVREIGVLPIVAITDGAQCIRVRVKALFGENVPIILDWYHLKQKIEQQLSRLGLVKAEKEGHINEMLAYLWKGQTTEALIYSDVMIKTKKIEILEELQNYLLKHQAEICNYQLRQLRNKTIGSGRGEKANDQMIGQRQKKNAMSWSLKGSNALCVIKSLKMNTLWEEYWQNTA